ncbi:hypothetical protein D5400_14010 [Georhizobium profundi]|uniref:Uncharacterized protein n=1 Tax=Georhizobium profundi TaxID=2341112 RepID=A0A3S9B5N2_9HYPH|nr:hypothetical protein D5400_14010 [Georhizobium profundi]
MFFTRIGILVAHALFWLSSLRLAAAVAIAFFSPDLETGRAFAERYLATASTGEAIDQTLMYIAIAIALGALCELSKRSRV